LDNTLYLFTSGRYEYKNKGFDLTLEALAKLNHRLKSEGCPKTVVMFFITRQPVHSINPDVLNSRAVMEEIRETCEAITKQVGERLFYEAAQTADTTLPQLNDFVEDYWKLRLRRTIQAWKSDRLPTVVTHNLVNDQKDDILNFLRRAELLNQKHDNVKIVYHPDFISPTSPLFGMEYGQFVRGCHIGVFPSYYEPWGYTPLECIASGVPAITSDLSGFGDYVVENVNGHKDNGIYVINRRQGSFELAAKELAECLYDFIHQDRREIIVQRNAVESSSVSFGWKKLTAYYDQAYQLALQRI
jgi:glycogen(starch) synthase